MLLPSNTLSKKGALCPGSAASKGNGVDGSTKMRARENWWKAVGGAFAMNGVWILASCLF
jgi:hypothetical protein